MKQTILGWVAAVSVGAPLLAFGQPAQPVAATSLKFQSAFDDYKPYRDIEPGDWRGLNDAVGAAALKSSGAQQAVTAAPGAPTPAPRAMPSTPAGAKEMKGMHKGVHGGHNKMHGGKP